MNICSEDTLTRQIAETLMNFDLSISPEDLFPAYSEEASRFAMTDPYAFCIAACLDRQTVAEVIWSIPLDIRNRLGHLDPYKIYEMSTDELEDLFANLPRKPRFVNDAPRTLFELTKIVVEECKGNATNIWHGKQASLVKRLFESIHGVGPGIANMAVLLLERASLYQFDERDHLSMDIKPDVQTVKVLFRLGLIQTKSEDDAVHAAYRLNPEYPGAVDSALWRIGRQWCLANNPHCLDCVLHKVCKRQGL